MFKLEGRSANFERGVGRENANSSVNILEINGSLSSLIQSAY